MTYSVSDQFGPHYFDIKSDANKFRTRLLFDGEIVGDVEHVPVNDAIAAAVAAEREACAKIAGDKSAWFSSKALASYGDDKITRMAQMDAADEIYRAIRDRQKP